MNWKKVYLEIRRIHNFLHQRNTHQLFKFEMSDWGLAYSSSYTIRLIEFCQNHDCKSLNNTE